MDIYENNGVCQYLEKKGHNIFLTDLTRSMLIIAEKDTQKPIALVLDDRTDDYKKPIEESEEETINIGKSISNKSGLPFFIVRYVDNEQSLFNTRALLVGFYNSSIDEVEYKEANIDYFVQLLNNNGIRAKYENRTPQKKKNDKLSSDFHYWQREYLNVGIFSDIDMIRYDRDKKEITRLYELKRAKEPFEEWKPYYKEFFNYKILANMCEMLGVQLYIVFNGQKKAGQRTRRSLNYYYKVVKSDGEEFYDDVMELRIFKMCKPVGGSTDDLVPVEAEHITIDHFIDDDTVGIFKEKYWNMRGKESESYSSKNRDICYCDPKKTYNPKYNGKKFFHSYEDCEWLHQNEQVKALYRYEAYAEGYKLHCKKCKARSSVNKKEPCDG